jgi:hypothetical protein
MFSIDIHFNCREYFDWIAEAMNIKYPEDWHEMDDKYVRTFMHDTFLELYYQDSILKALQSIYVDTTWHPWKFHRNKGNYWIEMENQREYIRWFEEKMQINSEEDWYGIKVNQLIENGGNSLLRGRYGGSMIELLKAHYSRTPWNSMTWIISSNSKAQKHIVQLLRNILPNNVEIVENARAPIVEKYLGDYYTILQATLNIIAQL